MENTKRKDRRSAAFTRELKYFDLRPSPFNQNYKGLSGTAQVYDGNIGYAVFTFSPRFYEKLNELMPNGISPEYPAYIAVYKHRAWRVVCRYLHSQEGVLLWEQSHKPHWLNVQYMETL